MMLSTQKELVRIKSDSAHIEGLLELPQHPVGIVLFAHGSSNSRLSPRNTYLASELRHAQMGTLLLDLLTKQEDQDYQARFDIALLTQRLNTATAWLQQYDGTTALPLGLFSNGTSTAAALQVAAVRGASIAAIVSRGGRPDLAGRHALATVRSPTLLIVGGADDFLINLNQIAYTALRCEKRLELIPGASRLFEEPGKLKAVSSLATLWFIRHLPRTS